MQGITRGVRPRAGTARNEILHKRVRDTGEESLTTVEIQKTPRARVPPANEKKSPLRVNRAPKRNASQEAEKNRSQRSSKESENSARPVIIKRRNGEKESWRGRKGNSKVKFATHKTERKKGGEDLVLFGNREQRRGPNGGYILFQQRRGSNNEEGVTPGS